MTEYMLSYWVYNPLSPTLMPASKKARSIERLKEFAAKNNIERGSVIRLSPNGNGVRVATYVGPIK